MGTLIIFIPAIKERVLETKFIRGIFACHSILDQKTCHEVLSYEIIHRVFLAIALYHFVLTCCLLPNFHEFRERLHHHCWILKLIIFTAFVIGTFSIPQQNYFIVYSSYIVLVGGSLFIVIQFFLLVDFAETLMELAVTKQDQSKRKLPSSILKLLIVLKTFDLFVFSFSTVGYVLVTTSAQDCTWNDIFIALNVGACFIAFAISLHPRIRLNIQPAVIFLPCAVVTSHSVMLLVIALSTQENPGCNLEATFLSAKDLSIGVNLRIILACLVMHTVLFYECLRSNEKSFILGLFGDRNVETCDQKDEAGTHESPYTYLAFHFLFSTASLYTSTTITNWYGPVTNRFSPSEEPFLLGLQAHWKPAETVAMVTCCVPVLVYICIMIYSIVRKETLNLDTKSQGLSEQYTGIMQEQGIECQRSSGSFNNKSYLKSYPNISNIDGDSLTDEVDLSAACKILTSDYKFEEKPDISSQSHLIVRCRHIQNTSIHFYHFPREICQSFYGGRSGSNACTIIAVLIARAFCCSGLEPQQTANLNERWINLFSSCIAEGNRLYDMLINSKQRGAIYLSVEDVVEEFGNELQIKNLGCSLPVSFVSETETATILFQLEKLRKKLNERLAVVFIKDSRSGVFLFDKDGPILFADSHPYGTGGALLACASSVRELVSLLANILHSASLENLGTLTPVYFH